MLDLEENVSGFTSKNSLILDAESSVVSTEESVQDSSLKTKNVESQPKSPQEAAPKSPPIEPVDLAPKSPQFKNDESPLRSVPYSPQLEESQQLDFGGSSPKSPMRDSPLSEIPKEGESHAKKFMMEDSGDEIDASPNFAMDRSVVPSSPLLVDEDEDVASVATNDEKATNDNIRNTVESPVKPALEADVVGVGITTGRDSTNMIECTAQEGMLRLS
jgi:hypothetical protein